ncbi:MAG: redoxin domain-containing protein [Bacteroidia bacterium]|nr:redoxin domain-containing protein [Bacteroidia bacterium]
MKKVFVFLIFVFPILSKASDSITVYLFLSEDCPICQYYSLELNELYQSYGAEIGFIGLFPNRASTERKIKEFKEKYKFEFPFKREYHQTISKKFGVKITPEVVVYNEDQKKIVYQGRIDNTYASLGRRRNSPTQTELRDVLHSIHTQKPIKTQNATAVGCFITFFN